MTDPEKEGVDNLSMWKVVIKGLLLFILINIIFVIINPLPFISKISIYNYIIH